MKIPSRPLRVDRRLDTLGELCPQPIIETARAARTMKQGQVLEILSDDWGMKPDIAAWCMSTGHQLLAVVEEQSFLRCFIKIAPKSKLKK